MNNTISNTRELREWVRKHEEHPTAGGLVGIFFWAVLVLSVVMSIAL
jgi:hypothetical protein